MAVGRERSILINVLVSHKAAQPAVLRLAGCSLTHFILDESFNLRIKYVVEVALAFRYIFCISSLCFLHASQPADRSASLSRQDVLHA